MRISDWISDVCSSDLSVPGRDGNWAIQQAVVAADAAAYRYSATRKTETEGGLERLSLLGAGDLGHQVAHGAAIASGVELDWKRALLGKGVSLRVNFGGARLI